MCEVVVSALQHRTLSSLFTSLVHFQIIEKKSLIIAFLYPPIQVISYQKIEDILRKAVLSSDWKSLDIVSLLKLGKYGHALNWHIIVVSS